jgi:hypothetical protein
MSALHADMLACLIGIQMMAALEARTGQTKWAEVLPILDDIIERAIAENPVN